MDINSYKQYAVYRNAWVEGCIIDSTLERVFNSEEDALTFIHALCIAGTDRYKEWFTIQPIYANPKL